MIKNKLYDVSKLPDPVKLNFVKFGGKNFRPPVIVLHALYDSKDSWFDSAKEFCEKTNRTVYCLDIRGRDFSTSTDNFTYQSMISDLIYFLEQNKIKKSAMIGHCIGGWVISRYATLFPDSVEKLIFVDVHPLKGSDEAIKSTIKLANKFKEFLESARNENLSLKMAKNKLDEVLKVKIKEEIRRKAYINNFVERNEQLDWRFNLNNFYDFFDYLNTDHMEIHFNGDSLLIHGDKSIFATKNDYESIKNLIPNIQFTCLEDANHFLFLTHPNEFRARVIEFLNN